MYLSLKSIIYVIPKSVLLSVFLFIMSFISLVLELPGNFLMNARHIEFYLFGCCIILNSFKYS